MAFSESARAGKRELVVRREALEEPEAAGVESGRDESIYSVITLNHLQLLGFAGLRSISPKISQLGGLLQLILTHNSLQGLPVEIRALTKLKHLDVSHNEITELPQSLYDLPSLHTVILGHNQLADHSFPSLPVSGEILPSLHQVDLTNNQLTHLPAFIYRATNISELLASDNVITELSPSIGALTSLRQLEIKRNKLTSLPYELTACSKLKTVGLEDNPLKDRRLMKLIAQHGAQKPKAVLDYIASHAPQPQAPERAPGKKKGGKKKSGKDVPVKMEEDSDSDIEFRDVKSVIRVLRPNEHVEVQASSEARQVRPYLVCAVVRGVRLEDEEAFREFIALQTKLHDTVCKRRRVATIATHDLSKLTLPLSYSCAPSEAISLLPLGCSAIVTARAFLDRLEANRPERGGGGRRAKPQDTAAAVLSKYLSFVEPSRMVYLHDSSDLVISLPPLTNSDVTKIEPATCDLLVEVTSSESLAACKLVMDTLLEGMVMCECVRVGGVLCVEQVRVVDGRGQLLVLYPSRTDLTSDKLDVVRP